MDLTPVIELYDKELDALPNIHQNGGGGDARNASGLLYENLIKRTCDVLGLDAVSYTHLTLPTNREV